MDSKKSLTSPPLTTDTKNYFAKIKDVDNFQLFLKILPFLTYFKIVEIEYEKWDVVFLAEVKVLTKLPSKS